MEWMKQEGQRMGLMRRMMGPRCHCQNRLLSRVCLHGHPWTPWHALLHCLCACRHGR